MQYESLLGRVRARFDGLHTGESYGAYALFYNPGERLAKGAYSLIMKTADGPNDRASDLGRHGVYRVSLQVPSETYRARFGAHRSDPRRVAWSTPATSSPRSTRSRHTWCTPEHAGSAY